ncbi:MAG: ATP-binding protein [Acidobacteria bacterium]|nr:ATP-binding protein [Acidobacteriota bacterium]MBV9067867.1 ATP-binding protein [Acidobacteriota bacterium]MBV9186778.1 ATP-binding protein [Acidobacteriota bacterium]
MKSTLRSVPFAVTARTVDHLGREQIADSPTAVSELWKNAYDAYATGVGLHVFEGPPAVAALFDDGHGMSADEFIERWLVLGTSAKLTDEVPEADRNGLPKRERQGQKGIGRLSVAFLGPVSLIISKRADAIFTASAVDWRAFENPFITLNDLNTPVAQFADRDSLSRVIGDLVESLTDNVWPKTNADHKRAERLRAAWDKYSAFEREAGTQVTTEDRMAKAAIDIDLTDDLLQNWSVWRGDRPSGTALVIFEPTPEIVVCVDPGVTGNSDESDDLQRNLRATLMGFVDPYAQNPLLFDYGVFAHRTRGTAVFLSGARQFDRSNFERLEHHVDGHFDKNGMFVGTVTAFGRSHGKVKIPPPWAGLRRAAPVGPFEFCIGTFEQEATNSTHTPEEHADLREQAVRYAGLRIYRDGLRVMPYGRPEADFFGIEERRSKHAGREFWQHRRVFGRVALSRKANPNLRDKAGREGLIDNTARRQLQSLVVHVLRYTAQHFFGSDAEVRQSTLDRVRAMNIAAREARDSARRLTNKRVLQHIRKNAPQLDAALQRTESLIKELSEAKLSNDRLAEIDRDVDALLVAVEAFRLPPRAGKLGLNEPKYLDFRSRFRDFADAVDSARSSVRRRYEERTAAQVADAVATRVRRSRVAVVVTLNDVVRRIQGALTSERARIDGRAAEDRKRVQVSSEALAARVDNAGDFRGVLEEVDAAFDTLRTEIIPYYEQYASTLERLTEGLSVDLALTSTLYHSSLLEERVSQLNALAQMGITVEIVGHELERLNEEAQTQFERLPQDLQTSSVFKRAMRAYDALVSRLRFLGPLKVSGPQLRERITGREIYEYVCDFFGAQLKERNIVLDATDAFLSMVVLDYHYRLLPVFMNLTNNALYWLQFVEERAIRMDVIGGDVVLSDNGPGVEPEDLENLFELFFTRRAGGRGIGLYLARANLGASGHTIQYRNGSPGLAGANFLIHFREMALGGDE